MPDLAALLQDEFEDDVDRVAHLVDTSAPKRPTSLSFDWADPDLQHVMASAPLPHGHHAILKKARGGDGGSQCDGPCKKKVAIPKAAAKKAAPKKAAPKVAAKKKSLPPPKAIAPQTHARTLALVHDGNHACACVFRPSISGHSRTHAYCQAYSPPRLARRLFAVARARRSGTVLEYWTAVSRLVI